MSEILFLKRENKSHISEAAVKCFVYYMDMAEFEVMSQQILAKQFKHLDEALNKLTGSNSTTSI